MGLETVHPVMLERLNKRRRWTTSPMLRALRQRCGGPRFILVRPPFLSMPRDWSGPSDRSISRFR